MKNIKKVANSIQLKNEDRKMKNYLSKKKFIEKQKQQKMKKKKHLEYLGKFKGITRKYKNNPKELQKNLDKLRKEYKKTSKVTIFKTKDNNIKNLIIKNIPKQEWDKFISYHANKCHKYYEKHPAGDYDGPEGKRIRTEVDIICGLADMRNDNKCLYDAYSFLEKFEPFKEKYKNYRNST